MGNLLTYWCACPSLLHLPTPVILAICMVALSFSALTLSFDDAVVEKIDSVTDLVASTPRKFAWDLRLYDPPPTRSFGESGALNSQPASAPDAGGVDGFLPESTADCAGISTGD